MTDDEARLHWNEWLLEFPFVYAYQSFGWGEYKRYFGWRPIRLVLRGEDNALRSMTQALIKRVPILGPMMWIPGGPVWKEKLVPKAALNLAIALDDAANPWFVRSFQMSEGFPVIGMPWRQPFIPIGSGVSMSLDLMMPHEEWLQSVSSKHRYYVRQAMRAPIEWRWGNDEHQLIDFDILVNEMWQAKEKRTQSSSVGNMLKLCQSLGDSVTTLIGYLDDRPISGCQVLRFGATAIYSTAATNQNGRKVSAAYAMIAELRERLRLQGAKTFDFGGIDPGNPTARGVDHFKSGFGGRRIYYDGEIEWASSSLARLIGNLAIKVRRRALS